MNAGETGVERVPAPPQSSYLGELSRAFWNAVAELMARTGAMLHLSHEALLWIASGLAVLAFTAIGWLTDPRLARHQDR